MEARTCKKLKEMLCKGLDEMAERGESSLRNGGLEELCYLAKTYKSVCEIEMFEEEGGYSQRGRGGSYSNSGSSYSGGSSYGSGSGGSYSGSSYEGGSSGRRGHYVRGHYSRADGQDSMIREMEEMMNSAGSDREREAIGRCMELMRNM